MTEIIELSTDGADVVRAPGDFTSSFAPKALGRGDQLYVRSAMIDTLVQQPGQQINLTSDLTLTFTYCFYEVDHEFMDFQAAKNYNPGVPNERPSTPTYLTYIAMIDGQLLLTRTVTIVVTAGMYTPAALASEITRLCVVVDESTVLAPVYNDSLGYATAKFAPTYSQLGYAEQGLGFLVTTYAFVRLNVLPDISTGTPPGHMNFDDRYTYTVGTRDDGINNTGDSFCGATQVGLSYDADGNGRWQFDYLHTPMMDRTSTSQQPVVIEIYNNLPPNAPAAAWYRHYLGYDSGCMLVDLQPRDFWTGLGFNLGIGPDGHPDGSGVLVAFQPGVQGRAPQLLNFNRDRHMTRNLYTTSSLLLHGTRYREQTNADSPGPLLHDSNATMPIRAAQWYRPDAAPYYLVELQANFDSSQYTQAGPDAVLSRHIAAIVSRAYTSNNYVLAYADGSLVYRHDSDLPLIISSIRVRILDAKTKDIAPSLGPRSYVVLQIDRALLGPSSAASARKSAPHSDDGVGDDLPPDRPTLSRAGRAGAGPDAAGSAAAAAT